MKFFAVASGFALALTGALAQITAPMQNYNVTSPVMNGAYVAGQMLPCTVTIFENVPAGMIINNNDNTITYGFVRYFSFC